MSGRAVAAIFLSCDDDDDDDDDDDLGAKLGLMPN
jgi:hypothetical protein